MQWLLCTAVDPVSIYYYAPQGTRKWRGTKAKLMSCEGTHTLHSAFRLSQISDLYLSYCEWQTFSF